LLPRAHPGASAWLVKFPGQGEDAQVGPLELAYLRMAGAAGIEVPPAELLGRTRTSPGYFAVQRFDRRGPRRIHLHTLGGLLELPRGYLAFDYRDLLATTRRLTRDDRAVSELFRRACFNVLARNRDDHVRNFAFLMDEEGVWRPSPAFDVTFSSGPRGEHSMLVMGEGLTPGVDHLRRLGQAGGVKKAEALLDEVRAALARFHAFADEAGVPAKLATRVGKALAVRRRRPSR
jgi:serine/threonine-protein kinase HipA